MTQRFLLILVVLVFTGLFGFSQVSSSRHTDSLPSLHAMLHPMNFEGLTTKANHSAALRPNQVTLGYGFFCRKELQIQKSLQLPVYFRLGSLDYVNRLEGKNEALK